MQKRKNYMIKKKFQINFLSKFLILLVLESVLIVGLFMVISGDTLTTGYLDSVLRVERTQEFFLARFTLMALIVVVGVAIAGLIVFTLLSHRIAGPLYRFEKVLEQVEAGDLTTRVKLRGTDQIVDVEKALNVLIGSLDGRMGTIKENVDELKALLAQRIPPSLLQNSTKQSIPLKMKVTILRSLQIIKKDDETTSRLFSFLSDPLLLSFCGLGPGGGSSNPDGRYGS